MTPAEAKTLAGEDMEGLNKNPCQEYTWGDFFNGLRGGRCESSAMKIIFREMGPFRIGPG